MEIFQNLCIDADYGVTLKELLKLMGGQNEEDMFQKLPEEIVLNILPWLPVNSQGRLKCVSRAFNNLTHQSSFEIKKMEYHSRSSRCTKRYHKGYFLKLTLS